MNPCTQILEKIGDLEAQLRKREAQLAEDRYDLFHRAHSSNPGGDMAGKGTYVGHIDMIRSTKQGLAKARVKARAMGCL